MATIYPQIFGRERRNLELSLDDNNNKRGVSQSAKRPREIHSENGSDCGEL